MIKLKDLLKEELTDADIKVGDAYYRKTHVGYVVSFVYDKSIYGGWTTIESVSYTHLTLTTIYSV